MKLRPIHVLSAMVVLGAAAGCGFPEPENGAVKCSSGAKQCPDGYACVARTNTCWKDGIDLGIDAGTAADLPAASDVIAPSDTTPSKDGPAPQDGAGVAYDTAATDGPVADTADGALADKPADAPADAPTDLPIADAPPTTDAPVTCTAPKILCNGQCIDPSTGACCAATDCAGPCMTCNADHACVAIKSQDDPTLRCAGTCDATGACKTKKGQPCTTTAGGCTSGTTCADGYCCDKACSGTCEACDIAGSLGTCTVLPKNGTPRAGRTACTGTAPCTGTCDGTSNACTFPTTSCGTATCSSNSYQAAGTCTQGTCKLPTAVTCTNACVVASGGCTGECAPDAVRCSTTGVPQKCSAAGAWQDQAACGTGFVCNSGTCACTAPKTTCTGACVDLQTDGNHCGDCNHPCLGGTCVDGACQPVAVTGTLSLAATVMGVDGSNIYYNMSSSAAPYAYDAYRVSKSATASNGTLALTAPQSYMGYIGTIGPTIFLYDAVGKMFSYTVGSGAADITPLPNNDPGIQIAYFRSQLPYFVQRNTDQSLQWTLTWYDMKNIYKYAYAETTVGIAPSNGYLSFSQPYAYGNSVYWIRSVVVDSVATAASGLFAASTASSSARSQLAGGAILYEMQIIDANAYSVLLSHYNSGDSYIYRVPLAGYGSNQPAVVAPGDTLLATEDAKAMYWFDSAGTLRRCSPANCQMTTVTLATGQGEVKGFYQDDTALYWGRGAPFRIMRLAK